MFMLIDGVLRNSRSDTFEIPTDAEKDMIRPGLNVRIGVTTASGQGERFWVLVTDVHQHHDGTVFEGRVDNELLYTAEHGLSLDDGILFRREHVLDIMSPTCQ